MKEIRFGTIGGLAIYLVPAAFAGSLVLVVLLFVVGFAALGLSITEALLFGLIGTALHWLGELLHQFGHAQAARQTGHAMIGVRLGTLGVLSTALYPHDEPALPGAIHIHRALGGPKWSIVMAAVGAGLTALLWNAAPVLRAIALLYFLEALFVFTLGAFLPLGFTDGSTILKWRGKA